jgi:tetratricopeptide (TPR) repeat protein
MRGDWPATANLWDRALAVLAERSALRGELMPDLALALRQMGSLERANQVAAEAVAAAEATGDVAAKARAGVTRTYCQFWLRPDLFDPEATRREGEHALVIFDKHDDDTGRSRAIFNIDIAEWASGNADKVALSAERGIRFARRAGIRPDELESCYGFSWSMCWGTTPAGAARRRIEDVVLGAGSDRWLGALAATTLAFLEGMEGRLSDAQERIEGGRRNLAELGLHQIMRQSAILVAQLAMLADEPALAEQALRDVLATPAAAEDRWMSTMAEAELTRVLHVRGHRDEALAVAESLGAGPPAVDLTLRMRCAGARALVLGSLGRHGEAEQLAREAVEVGRSSDFLNLRGDTLVDLAEILKRADRPEEAAARLREAVNLYERKGNVVSAATARATLAELA